MSYKESFSWYVCIFMMSAIKNKSASFGSQELGCPDLLVLRKLSFEILAMLARLPF